MLKVISRSTFDLQAVLDTLVESAVRLCDADMAAIYRLSGTIYEHAASHWLTPAIRDYMTKIQFEPVGARSLGELRLNATSSM